MAARLHRVVLRRHLSGAGGPLLLCLMLGASGSSRRERPFLPGPRRPASTRTRSPLGATSYFYSSLVKIDLCAQTLWRARRMAPCKPLWRRLLARVAPGEAPIEVVRARAREGSHDRGSR